MSGTVFVVHVQGRMSERPEGRYEYRVWPGLAHPAISRLQRTWRLVAAERRSDIYLLGPWPDRVLAKLRGGQRLEIKRHKCDVGNVQHWTMPVSTGFPLGSRHRSALARALGLSDPLNAEMALSPAYLLAAFGGQTPAVVTQTVRKSRLLFENGDCRAEICRVHAGDWADLTIALEAATLPAIALAINDLQLGGLANRSYGDVLGHLFGPRPTRFPLLSHAQPRERR